MVVEALVDGVAKMSSKIVAFPGADVATVALWAFEGDGWDLIGRDGSEKMSPVEMDTIGLVTLGALSPNISSVKADGLEGRTTGFVDGISEKISVATRALG